MCSQEANGSTNMTSFVARIYCPRVKGEFDVLFIDIKVFRDRIEDGEDQRHTS